MPKEGGRSGSNMKGTRRDFGEGYLLEEGEYGKDTRSGIWHCRPPGYPHMGNLAAHTVTEHDDGTITVSPSILINYNGRDGVAEWHGYLEHGEWRQC